MTGEERSELIAMLRSYMGASPTCRDAADELRRLGAIVDRLPKTADGVPIAIGDRVYYRFPSGHVDERPGASVAWLWGDGKYCTMYWDGGYERGAEMSRCYSSLEAAEAAASGGAD